MLTIGLTGMSGSGKSYVAAIFSRYGIATVNADAIVHRLYQGKNPCTELLRERFGDSVIHTDHSVNRKNLAAIVFSDPQKLKLLNETVHPFVLCEIDKAVDSARQKSAQAILIDAPQLFESHLDDKCDLIIAVIADEQTRVTRIARRDGISQEDAKKRLSHQYPDEFFIERADYCIRNSDHDSPEAEIVSLLTKLDLLP